MDVLKVLDVVVVPLVLAVLGLIGAFWPRILARQRRRTYEDLLVLELSHAAPQVGEDLEWHEHLAHRFLHEEIIRNPVENVDFVLSLSPELSYPLSQMWIEYDKAKASRSDPMAGYHAQHFCIHLKEVVDYLDKRHRETRLPETVWKPWSEMTDNRFPDQVGGRRPRPRRGRVGRLPPLETHDGA